MMRNMDYCQKCLDKSKLPQHMLGKKDETCILCSAPCIKDEKTLDFGDNTNPWKDDEVKE